MPATKPALFIHPPFLVGRLWVLLAVLALCGAAGCGGGEKVKKYYFNRPEGHFRGVIYATESPAPGENPIYTVDFTQQGSVVKDVSTYQSTTEATGGQIDGLFAYSDDGTPPVENLIFHETYHQNMPTVYPDYGASSYGFYVSFGPPTNNGTHFDGIFIEAKSTGDSSYGPRHKAIFDKVP